VLPVTGQAARRRRDSGYLQEEVRFEHGTVFNVRFGIEMRMRQTTVRVDPKTEKGQRYLRLLEQARVKAAERLAAAEADSPPKK
jgi:hypothetical protein